MQVMNSETVTLACIHVDYFDWDRNRSHLLRSNRNHLLDPEEYIKSHPYPGNLISVHREITKFDPKSLNEILPRSLTCLEGKYFVNGEIIDPEWIKNRYHVGFGERLEKNGLVAVRTQFGNFEEFIPDFDKIFPAGTKRNTERPNPGPTIYGSPINFN